MAHPHDQIASAAVGRVVGRMQLEGKVLGFVADKLGRDMVQVPVEWDKHPVGTVVD